MTREEFIVDAVKNPGKVYRYTTNEWAGYIYWRLELTKHTIRFLHGDKLNNIEVVPLFIPQGNYQPLETPEPSFVEKYLSIPVEYYSEEEKQRIFKMRAELIQSYVDEQIEKLRKEMRR